MAKVAFDQDSLGLPFRFLNGRFDRKVSSSQSGGGLCIFDTVRSERGGPPLHIHADQDEWFLVTEGEFDIRVDDETFHLGPGDSVFGPRGLPHAFANTTETGRITVVFSPAGSMEQFFAAGSERGRMTPPEFAALSAEHGMKVVGPPLPIAG
jgi:mannose-6-phosphate isomerase-like protein (cupin superfamily)